MRISFIIRAIININLIKFVANSFIYENFDIRSKYDGFMVYNNQSNPYVLLKTSAGVFFLLDGEQDTCYHPKAYLTATQHRDHFVAIDNNRNALFSISYNRFLFQYNLESGRYNTIIADKTDQMIAVGAIEWLNKISYLEYSDKYRGAFNLLKNGWVMFWDIINDLEDPENKAPSTNVPVTHTNLFRNASGFHVTSFVNQMDIIFVAHGRNITYCDIFGRSRIDYVQFKGNFAAMASNQIGNVFFVFIEENITPVLYRYGTMVVGGFSVIDLQANSSHRLDEDMEFIAFAVTNDFLVLAVEHDSHYIFIMIEIGDDWKIIQKINCPYYGYDIFNSKRFFYFDFEEIFIVDPKRMHNYEEFPLKKNKIADVRNIEISNTTAIYYELWIKMTMLFTIACIIIVSLIFIQNDKSMS